MDGVLVHEEQAIPGAAAIITRSGIELGLRTVLVLTGSTRREQVEHFPYRPTRIVNSIADVIPLVDELRRV